MPLHIRPESPQDPAAIHAVTAAAFANATHTSGTEQHIVDALRRAGRLTVSLVAVDDNVVVGHVAVSPVTVSDGASGWQGLGPVSVLPAYQGQGIGRRLIEAAIEQLQARDAAGCVVLGEPGYYGRFGFRATPSLVLPDVPAEYFQALVFHGPIPNGVVRYDPAFDAQG